jgi:hypothetical protein
VAPTFHRGAAWHLLPVRLAIRVLAVTSAVGFLRTAPTHLEFTTCCSGKISISFWNLIRQQKSPAPPPLAPKQPLDRATGSRHRGPSVKSTPRVRLHRLQPECPPFLRLAETKTSPRAFTGEEESRRRLRSRNRQNAEDMVYGMFAARVQAQAYRAAVADDPDRRRNSKRLRMPPRARQPGHPRRRRSPPRNYECRRVS